MIKTFSTLLFCLYFQFLLAQNPGELFWKAAKTNDVKTLQELLEKGTDVDIKTIYGVTALMYAVDKENAEAVEFLLRNKANPNNKDSFYGMSIFSMSIYKGNQRIIKALIENGLDISTEDPLVMASRQGLAEIVQLLVEKGAPGTDKALINSIKNKDTSMVAYLLENIKFTEDVLGQAMITAVSLRDDPIISLLKNAGATLPEKKEDLKEITEGYQGIFKSKEENRIETLIRESKLTVSFNGGPAYGMERKTGETFHLTDYPEISLTFHFSGNKAYSVVVVQGLSSQQYTRIDDEGKLEAAPGDKEYFINPVGKVLKALNWPSFRGSNADGIADGQYPPLNFDGLKGINMRWKTYIPGLAHSSPVIWDNMIFLTTALSSDTASEYRVGLYGNVEPAKDVSSHIWKMYCIDRKTGKISWEKIAYEGIPRVKRHPKGTQANATPVTNGTYVVAIFGSEGMVCYDFKGKEIWRKDLGIWDAGWFFEEETQWGPASSPIIYGNTVIVQCDRSKGSFIAAFDLKTGKEVWKTMREEISSWATPTIYQGGKHDELIANGTKFIKGYDPRTGEELWRLAPSSEVTVGTPVVHEGLIFVSNGYAPVQPVYAIKPGGRGDISIADSLNSGGFIQWRLKRGGTYMPSLIAYKSYLYTVNNNGILNCYVASTGERKYRETLKDGHAFSASPVAADGKLYFTSEEKGILVVKAGPEFELIAINPVGEICMATPAISDGQIFVRGQKHLFCFGRK